MKCDKIGILIKKSSLNFERLANPILNEYDLTDAQFKLLKYLFSHKDQAVRLVDLEKYYSLTHPTTIGLLNTLEKKGFIVRKDNPKDARSKIIVPTEKTLSMEDTLHSLGNRLEEEFTSELSDDEKIQLTLLLKKLLSKFQGEVL